MLCRAQLGRDHLWRFWHNKQNSSKQVPQFIPALERYHTQKKK
uniref:Uncharacterized protein n=1 Tax=Arundo donax TaxID=35708 RepID=A0A0A9GIR9_ARUDO